MINKIVIHFIIVQAHFLLSSTTQVSMGPLSMLSKVWFTNAHCIYWNKNQVKNVLTYIRDRIKGEVIFSIWDVSIWLLEFSKFSKLSVWNYSSSENQRKIIVTSLLKFFLLFYILNFSWHECFDPRTFLSYKLDLAQFQSWYVADSVKLR